MSTILKESFGQALAIYSKVSGFVTVDNHVEAFCITDSISEGNPSFLCFVAAVNSRNDIFFYRLQQYSFRCLRH